MHLRHSAGYKAVMATITSQDYLGQSKLGLNFRECYLFNERKLFTFSH
jgi:hypothetical protein